MLGSRASCCGDNSSDDGGASRRRRRRSRSLSCCSCGVVGVAVAAVAAAAGAAGAGVGVVVVLDGCSRSTLSWRASLGARTLLVAPGITTRNKKLLGTRASL